MGLGFWPGEGAYLRTVWACLGQKGRTQQGDSILTEAGCAVGGQGLYEKVVPQQYGEAFSRGQGQLSHRMASQRV